MMKKSVLEYFRKAASMPANEKRTFFEDRYQDDPSLPSAVKEYLMACPSSFLEEPIFKVFTDFLNQCHPDAGHFPKIEGYRILDSLGSGGMGSVFLAFQSTPIRRLVALKVLTMENASEKMRARFEWEYQVLAQMSHAGIAKVFDAGKTEDGYWFSMEYVHGPNIVNYWNGRNSAVTDRVALCLQLCEAVHYAHQHGVIHRDLKPGNILVTDHGGQAMVKVIDFGISRPVLPALFGDGKLQDPLQRMGTVGYASPEQMGGSNRVTDLRTDVYSLCVVMHEFLFNSHPLAIHGEIDNDVLSEKMRGVNLAEGSLMCQNQKSQTRFERRLLLIIKKGMAYQPEDRYASVALLVDDLHRLQDKRPLLAEPSSVWQDGLLFVDRHRNKVIISSLFFATWIVASVFMMHAWQREQRAAFRADELAQLAAMESEQANATTEFMLNLFTESDSYSASGQANTRSELLDQCADHLSNAFHEQPRVKAELHQTLGRYYLGLGKGRDAAYHFKENYRLLMAAFGPNHPETLFAESMEALPNIWRNRWEESRRLLQNVIARWQQYDLPLDHRYGVVLGRLAESVSRTGDHARALSLYRDALAIQDQYRKLVLPRDYFSARLGFAYSLAENGQHQKANTEYQSLLEKMLDWYGERHPLILAAKNNFGLLLFKMGKSEDAIAIHQEVLSAKAAEWGEKHPNVATAMINLATSYYEHGLHKPALPFAESAVNIFKSRLGPEHVRSLAAVSNLGMILCALNRHGEAEARLRDAYKLGLSSLREDHPTNLRLSNHLAEALRGLGRYAEAFDLLKNAYKLARAEYGEEYQLALALSFSLAEVHLARLEFSEAQTIFESGFNICERTLGKSHPYRLLFRGYLGYCLIQNGERELGLEHLRAVVPKMGRLNYKQAEMLCQYYQTITDP